jgi:hypothetical protein
MIALLMLTGTVALADEQTEKEVRQAILDSYAHTNRTNRGRAEEYSKDGSIEFWSSGGVMHKVGRDDAVGEYDEYNINAFHIEVVTLVPGKAAVAHYYAQGSMKPKGSPAVPNYFTRATQVFVKEDGAWKIRSAHWSAVLGGTGTSQTSLQEED